MQIGAKCRVVWRVKLSEPDPADSPHASLAAEMVHIYAIRLGQDLSVLTRGAAGIDADVRRGLLREHQRLVLAVLRPNRCPGPCGAGRAAKWTWVRSSRQPPPSEGPTAALSTSGTSVCLICAVGAGTSPLSRVAGGNRGDEKHRGGHRVCPERTPTPTTVPAACPALHAGDSLPLAWSLRPFFVFLKAVMQIRSRL